MEFQHRSYKRSFPSGPLWKDLFFGRIGEPLSELPPPRLPEPQARRTAPFGYVKTWPGRHPRFDVLETEARAVRPIFSRVVKDGSGPRAAWKELSKRGGLVGRNGKPMGFESLMEIVGNPFYLGLRPWHGEFYAGTHEPLVDEAAWAAALRNVESWRANIEERREARIHSYLPGGKKMATYLASYNEKAHAIK